MIIQHNIPAMNAYRNYTNNTSALQSNLEKLSSGYRINKAGDDAAGLAISEKMRAQITGLATAQKNAKDGISLVQTAEGALTEVHDMLNRMYELAEQSANGTYSDDVDREQLQKEIESLNTEINRIADSTNFNGKKLLDGSLTDETITTTNNSSMTIGGELPAVGNTLNSGMNTVLHKEGSPATDETHFSVEFHSTAITGVTGDQITLKIGSLKLTGTLQTDDGVSAEDIAKALGDSANNTDKITFTYLDADGTEQDYDSTQVTIDGATFSAATDGEGVKFTQQDGDTPTSVAFDVSIEAGTAVTRASGTAPTVIATAGYAAAAAPTVSGATNVTSLISSSSGSVTVDLSDVSLDGGTDGLTLFIATGATVTSNKIVPDDASDPEAIAKAFVGTSFTYGADTFTAELDPTDSTKIIFKGVDTSTGTTASTATISASSSTLTASTLSEATGSATVNFGTKTGADVIGSSITIDGVTYQFYDKTNGTDPSDSTNNIVGVGVDESDAAAALATALEGKADTTGNVASAAAGTNPDVDDMIVTFTGATGVTTLDISSSASSSAPALEVTGQRNWVTTDQSVKADAGDPVLASTQFTLTQDMATSGNSIRIGDETYTFTDDIDNNGQTGYVYVGDLDLSNTADLAKAAERLSDMADGNAVYTVGHDGSGNITLTEQVGYTTGSQAYDLSTEEGIENSLGFNVTKTTGGTGSPLTLQIGDTADDYNKMKVQVKDMHASAIIYTDDDGNQTALSDINISTQDGASAAMDVIKNAINYVSDVRGDLGAIQNRLDHTINNLSVAEENITDAESTIRDVDIAEEMMSYTKNNILVQAAQAMLAQANQLPQGVLQLLQ